MSEVSPVGSPGAGSVPAGPSRSERLLRAVVLDWGGVLTAGSGPDAPMLALVARLKEVGLRTAVLSNAEVGELPIDTAAERSARADAPAFGDERVWHDPPGHDGPWAAYRWDELFDCVVVSGAVGMRKPESRIYRHVARALDVRPGECLFIDDLRSNVDAAVGVGMVGIVHVTYEQTLMELEGVLDLSFQ